MQAQKPRDPISLILQLILITGSVAYVLVFAIIAFRRMSYPFELEWMEGGSLVQVMRLLHGQGLYVPPSLEYVPFIYPPLYFYLSAVAARVIGIGFLPLRLTSFLSSIGSFFLIFLIVRGESHSNLASAAAAGLYAATYRVGGAWFDVARVDAVGLFFLLSGLFLIRNKSAASQVLAGLSFALAFFTKQTFLLAALPVLIYQLWRIRQKSLWVIGTLGFLAVFCDFAFNGLSGGWYDYYVWFLPSRHVLNLASVLNFSLIQFWPYDLLEPLGLACLVALASLVLPKTEGESEDPFLCWAAAVGMVGVSWLGTLNAGGYNNVLLPAYASISILAGLGLGRVSAILAQGVGAAGLAASRLALLACGIQFVALLYPIRPQIPTSQDLAAGEELVREIRSLPGDVFIPSHGYLGILAGKSSFAHQIALTELEGGYGGAPTEAWNAIHADFENRLREGTLGAVILDDPILWGNVGEYLPVQSPAFREDSEFYPVTGWKTRPNTIYTR